MNVIHANPGRSLGSQGSRPMPAGGTLAFALTSFICAFVALGCGADPDSGAGEEPSQSGRYRIAVRPAKPPVALGEMHDWIVVVQRRDGARAGPTTVAFDGGMPSHGHGFVTTPRVTRQLGEGEFLVEGVKFHMAGEWVISVVVSDADGSERATFPLEMAP